MTGKNNILNKKFLILGGSGYLGSSFVDKLEKENVFIYLHTNNNNNKYKNKNIKVIKGDITTKNFWKKNIKNKHYLINFASAENTFLNKKTLDDDYDLNAKSGIYALINAYKFNKKIKIIFFGSENQETKLNISKKDEFKSTPHIFFGLNKDTLEKYSIYFKNFLKLKVVFLRFSNIYGPSTNKQLSLRSSYNKIIHSALNGKINLFENKKSKRNIIFIDDVITSIFATIYKFDSLNADYYYICGSRSLSILQFSKIIIKSLKKNNLKVKLKFINKSLSNFDHRNFYRNNSKFKKKAKWKPLNTYTIGIDKTIKYFKNKS